MKEANLPFMSRVEESHFKRKLVVVPGMVHEYRHGYQHVLPKYSHIFFLLLSLVEFYFNRINFRSDIYMKNIHGTMVVWLQNNVGFTRWGPIESRVEALLDAFRPVREKERDKTQGINRDSDFELRMLNN